MPRRRVGIAWILPVITLAALSAGVGWYLWPRPALARQANETIELPLVPPGGHAWAAVSAFGQLKFAEPVFLTSAPGDEQHLYVLERRGTIQAIDYRAASPGKRLVLDISKHVDATADGDNGALGLAFHPRFGQADAASRGDFFLLYTYKTGNERYNRLSRFTLRDGQTPADPASEQVLIDQLDENEWHDGGSLAFGPDGFLYLGMGDEGHAYDHFQNSQKIDADLFSGILRIDIDRVGGSLSHPPPRQPLSGRTANYFVPNDNPFVGTPGVLEEFWALGLRNPYRMSFDRDGRLWVADVGQNLRESICLVTRGSNHRWSYAEGTLPFELSYLKGRKPQPLHGVETLPVFEYAHLNGNYCAIGGYVYQGRQFPELAGKYIYGDNVSGRVWALELDAASGRVVSNGELLDLPYSSKSGLSSFGQDADGELYLCVLGMHGGEDGQVLRLQRAVPGEGNAFPRLLSKTGVFSDLASLTPEAGVIPYDVNSPLWSDGAHKTRWMMVPGNGQDPVPENDRIDFAAEGSWKFPIGTVFIKHFELALDESDPDTRKRLETRLLICGTSGVFGATYRWNEDGTDAELLNGALKETFAIRQSGGGTRQQTWQYPSPADCLACHTQTAGYVLGMKTNQMNRAYHYKFGVDQNQLQALSDAGFFRTPIDRSQISRLPRLVPIDDTTADLETRVRSYLDANCASCHRPAGVRSNFDARFETPLAETRLIEGQLQKDFGLPDARVVKPREAFKSMLVLRLLDATHKMPPLGSTERDLTAIDTLCRWIDSLPAPDSPDSQPPANAVP